ncbi:MAG: hypothetical protein AAGF12_37045 [Myxococcota bacterium]
MNPTPSVPRHPPSRPNSSGFEEPKERTGYAITKHVISLLVIAGTLAFPLSGHGQEAHGSTVELPALFDPKDGHANEHPESERLWLDPELMRVTAGPVTFVAPRSPDLRLSFRVRQEHAQYLIDLIVETTGRAHGAFVDFRRTEYRFYLDPFATAQPATLTAEEPLPPEPEEASEDAIGWALAVGLGVGTVIIATGLLAFVLAGAQQNEPMESR